MELKHLKAKVFAQILACIKLQRESTSLRLKVNGNFWNQIEIQFEVITNHKFHSNDKVPFAQIATETWRRKKKWTFYDFEITSQLNSICCLERIDSCSLSSSLKDSDNVFSVVLKNVLQIFKFRKIFSSFLIARHLCVSFYQFFRRVYRAKSTVRSELSVQILVSV